MESVLTELTADGGERLGRARPEPEAEDHRGELAVGEGGDRCGPGREEFGGEALGDGGDAEVVSLRQARVAA
jgi:hypothetical protein